MFRRPTSKGNFGTCNLEFGNDCFGQEGAMCCVCVCLDISDLVFCFSLSAAHRERRGTVSILRKRMMKIGTVISALLRKWNSNPSKKNVLISEKYGCATPSGKLDDEKNNAAQGKWGLRPACGAAALESSCVLLWSGIRKQKKSSTEHPKIEENVEGSVAKW